MILRSDTGKTFKKASKLRGLSLYVRHSANQKYTGG